MCSYQLLTFWYKNHTKIKPQEHSCYKYCFNLIILVWYNFPANVQYGHGIGDMLSLLFLFFDGQARNKNKHFHGIYSKLNNRTVIFSLFKKKKKLSFYPLTNYKPFANLSKIELNKLQTSWKFQLNKEVLIQVYLYLKPLIYYVFLPVYIMI